MALLLAALAWHQYWRPYTVEVESVGHAWPGGCSEMSGVYRSFGDLTDPPTSMQISVHGRRRAAAVARCYEQGGAKAKVFGQ